LGSKTIEQVCRLVPYQRMKMSEYKGVHYSSGPEPLRIPLRKFRVFEYPCLTHIKVVFSMIRNNAEVRFSEKGGA